jgi:hypothetical protein
MTYELPIEGVRQIPGFNGVGVINLEDYIIKKVLPPKIRGGEFSHIGVFDLNTIEEDDDRLLNIGIREEGNTEERIQSFENEFEVAGFLTKDPPPIMGTNGEIRDGRGRIIAAKRRGERYIPVYYYSITDDSLKSKITDGLKENLRHDPAFSATMESVILGCLMLIKYQELTLSEVEVRKYLHTELEIQNDFAAHNITKIVNAVLRRGVGGGDPLVLVQDAKKWVEWCKKAGVVVDGKKVVLLSADNETYPWRAWCQHILPAIVKNNQPIEIIPYSKCHIPKEAKQNIQKFKAELQFILESSYLMVEKDYAPTWPMGNLELPVKNVPYYCYRTIPQLIGKHDSARKGYRFVEIDKY